MKMTVASFLPLTILFAGVTLAHAEIATVRVESRPVSVSWAAEATLEAVREATLAAQVPGRIVALNVDAGDRILKGDVLIRLDASEANQLVSGAKAAIAQAEANLLNAKASHERTARLLERKFVSPSALDQAKAARDAAEAQLRAARAGRSRSEAARAYSDIAAPLTGLVAARHAEQGDMAQPGRPLLTVYDPRAMRAVVDVPQQRLGAAGGRLPKARVELPESNRWFDASAVTVLPAADPRTHTVRVRVDLPPDTVGLVPGMFARVHFSGGDDVRVGVPASAIVKRGELTGVYVADGKGGFRLRQIRAGEALADGRVEVLAGLAGGEAVALDAVQAAIEARAAAAADTR